MSTHPLPTPFARRLRVVTLVIGAFSLAACGQSADDGADPPSTEEPSTQDEVATEPATPDDDDDDADDGTGDGAGGETDVDSVAFTDCEADRYTVGYPEDWTTNSGDGLLGPCEIFHPGDIDEPERPRDRDLHHAVSMYIDQVDLADRDPSDSRNEILEERETTVDGRSALVVEYRSTGDALTPEGERSYTWSIDLDGEMLVATTSSVGETDYERDKRILDRMVTDELAIDDGTAAGAAPIGGPATTERSTQEPDGWPLTVTDVRLGAHGSFDRITFEIAGDGEAGWLIEYEDEPRSQGRGDPVEVEGDAALRVALRGMAYPTDAPEPPYDGPERITPDRLDAIVEVVEDVLYEGYHDFFVGLDAERPYRVERLTEPQRVVIDIETG
jgi:hypothetical protein